MNKQSGFGAVEIIGIIVIVGLAGALGWTYMNRSDDTQESVASSSKSRSSEDKASTTKSNTIKLESSIVPFTLEYPEDWKTQETPAEDGLTGSVSLTASGTTFQEGSAAYKTVTNGAEVVVSCAESGYGSVKDFMANDTIYNENSSNKKQVSVAGSDAVQFDVSYEGPAKYMTVFYVNGDQCSVVIQKDVYQKQDFKSEYDAIVSSIKF